MYSYYILGSKKQVFRFVIDDEQDFKTQILNQIVSEERGDGFYRLKSQFTELVYEDIPSSVRRQLISFSSVPNLLIEKSLIKLNDINGILFSKDYSLISKNVYNISSLRCKDYENKPSVLDGAVEYFKKDEQFYKFARDLSINHHNLSVLMFNNVHEKKPIFFVQEIDEKEYKLILIKEEFK